MRRGDCLELFVLVVIPSNAWSGVIQHTEWHADIRTLTEMRVLGMARCGLSGDLAVLKDMKMLEVVLLYENNLSGDLLPGVGIYEHLRTFNVENNRLNGTIPTTLGRSTELKTLTAHTNQLRGKSVRTPNRAVSHRTHSLRGTL